jgi:hypothetical protein
MLDTHESGKKNVPCITGIGLRYLLDLIVLFAPFPAFLVGIVCGSTEWSFDLDALLDAAILVEDVEPFDPLPENILLVPPFFISLRFLREDLSVRCAQLLVTALESRNVQIISKTRLTLILALWECRPECCSSENKLLSLWHTIALQLAIFLRITLFSSSVSGLSRSSFQTNSKNKRWV